MSQTTNSLVSSLDLDDFEDLQTGSLSLVNPKTGEPTSSSIELASKEHPSRKKIDLARSRKVRTAYMKTGKIPNVDPLDEIEDETDYLVGVTLGWNLAQGGKPLEFSAEAVRKLFTDPKKQWVRQQVLDALNKNELFINNSAKA